MDTWIQSSFVTNKIHCLLSFRLAFNSLHEVNKTITLWRSRIYPNGCPISVTAWRMLTKFSIRSLHHMCRSNTVRYTYIFSIWEQKSALRTPVWGTQFPEAFFATHHTTLVLLYIFHTEILQNHSQYRYTTQHSEVIFVVIVKSPLNFLSKTFEITITDFKEIKSRGHSP